MSSSQTLNIGAESAPYFRTPEFSGLMKENEHFFLELIDAPADSRCVFLTSSGTGAMESAVMNVLNKKDKALVINGGSFGKRFLDLCHLHQVPCLELALEFGKNVQADDLDEYEKVGLTALLVNMHETSSGTLYNMRLLADFCKRNNLLFVVDAISSFIADELDMSDLGADVVITGSQKALAVPPGVSIMALSPKALERVEMNHEVCMYLSLKEALKNGERGQTPFTPAVTTLLQIHERFLELKKNGMENERSLIVERAREIRNAISSLSLPFEYVSESMSNAVTCVKMPQGGAQALIEGMKKDYGIWLCPNGGQYSDIVFRIGHIGYITHNDNQKLIDAFADMKEKSIL